MAKKKQDTPEMKLYNFIQVIQTCESTIESYRQAINEREKLIEEKTEEIARLQKLTGPLKVELLDKAVSSLDYIEEDWLAIFATNRENATYYFGTKLEIDADSSRAKRAYLRGVTGRVFIRELETQSDLVALIRGLGYEACGMDCN